MAEKRDGCSWALWSGLLGSAAGPVLFYLLLGALESRLSEESRLTLYEWLRRNAIFVNPISAVVEGGFIGAVIGALVAVSRNVCDGRRRITRASRGSRSASPIQTDLLAAGW
jgi:hypothetical protein